MAAKRGAKRANSTSKREIKNLPPKAPSAGQTRSVKGGKQKPDGTAAGNVAAKWSIAQGAVA